VQAKIISKQANFTVEMFLLQGFYVFGGERKVLFHKKLWLSKERKIYFAFA
jgi:hypothetical protein